VAVFFDKSEVFGNAAQHLGMCALADLGAEGRRFDPLAPTKFTLPLSRTPAIYDFQPTAKDTVKSRIKFNIYNKPAWASFDEATGKLSGRPSRRDVGRYGNITIRLTDWYGYVTTAPFSITVVNAPAATPAPIAKVTPVVTPAPVAKPVPVVTPAPVPAPAPVISAGNAVLDWMPPTENNDGTVLTDLAGYKVHYGTSPDQLTQVIKVTNPGLTSYVVENLSGGTWYFAVTSYSADGMESSNSAVVSTTIL
jgi:Putative Ig domain